MAEKESESEAETIETGWSVSTSRVLIQFYSENPLLWDKNHKEYGKKNIITKTLKPLLAKLGKSRAPNTEEAVKKRWHGLRSTTIRNLKKPVECKWVFWEDLRFLRDHLSVVTAEDDENLGKWSVQDTEMLISHFQQNPVLWNHLLPEYHTSNNDLLYDALANELENKDVEDIKKQWKSLVAKFRKEYKKASNKPSGSGTAEVYNTSFIFFKHMQFINVVFEEEETVDSITPNKNKVLKLSKQQLRDEREEKKLQLFSEAVLAIKENPAPKKEESSSEAEAFCRYVALSLSKMSSQRFRKAKKCISDILYSIEEDNVPPRYQGFQMPYNPAQVTASSTINSDYRSSPTPLDAQYPPQPYYYNS